MKSVCRWSFSLAVVATLSCTQKAAPKLEPAAPPAFPAPVVRDAAPDAVADAATDAGDARGPGRRKLPAPSSGGGGGGLKIEGGLPRAEGEKVVRGAQSKLRACFEAGNSKGPGRKGRVTYKMMVNDRGHVTAAEIPTSTLSGGSDVETCMVHVLRDLRFPRGGGESTVNFQMSFGS
jgi:hypothetical protein